MKRKAQSTLEYLLLAAGVTLVILYGVKSVVTTKAKTQMDTAGIILETADTNLKTALGVGE